MIVKTAPYGHDTITVGSLYGHGTVTARLRYGHDTVTVGLPYGDGRAITVRLRQEFRMLL